MSFEIKEVTGFIIFFILKINQSQPIDNVEFQQIRLPYSISDNQDCHAQIYPVTHAHGILRDHIRKAV